MMILINCIPSRVSHPSIQMNCNRFDHNHILHQWLKYCQLAKDELEAVLGPAKENLSDGDARRRKLQMGQSSDVNEGERFKPILVEDGFLFSAQVRDDSLICNYSDQDYIHNHKKLDRHLDHQARTLSHGTVPRTSQFPTASSGCVPSTRTWFKTRRCQ